MTELVKGKRITGTDRQKLGKQLKKRYESGASIRELATDTGRSYGFVHRVLLDEGTTLRGRGGATRIASRNGKKAAKSPATKATAKKAKKTTTKKR